MPENKSTHENTMIHLRFPYAHYYVECIFKGEVYITILSNAAFGNEPV